MQLRVLVLSDRDHPRPQAVYDDLSRLFLQSGLKTLTVIHSGHPTGPDRMVRTFIADWRPWTVYLARDVVEEVHEPPWSAYGELAPIRNDWGMFRANPHLALAYPGPASTRIEDWQITAHAKGLDLTVR